MRLSAKQLAAAHRLGQDVCVIAGPGSGKTSVLIERFAWLVRDQHIHPHRILAITFTEKAATEIKQRLVREFETEPGLRQQIERAWVSSIDAFCARLLREHAIAAGLDPQFQICDESPSRLLLRQAADVALESLYAEQPDGVRKFLRALAVSPDADGPEPDLAKSLIDIYIKQRLGADVGGQAKLFCDPEPELRRLLPGIPTERVVWNTPNQRQEHGKLNDWIARFLALQPPVKEEHFRVLADSKFHAGFLVKNSLARQRASEIKTLTAELRGLWLLEMYKPERELVLEALRRLDEAYRQRLRDQSLVDFAGLEENSIHLLERQPKLRNEIQQTFDHILMDELQDTNPLQWRLLDLLRRKDNFFAVGDINQSIFRFRHAEPQLFAAYRARLESEGKAIDELHDNWRSRPEILSAVNQVFGDPPDGIAGHTLTTEREFPAAAGPGVEVIGATGDDAEATELRWIARRVTELTSNYSDVAILTRTNAVMADVQAALDEFGVPSIVIGGQTFFESREVRDLILLLEVLSNPRNEIALAGLLRSPVIGMSDEELLRWKLKGPLWDSLPAGIAELRPIRDAISPDRMLRRVIDDSDYESGLSDRARGNIEKLLGILRDRWTSAPCSLSQLLDEIRSRVPESEAPPQDLGNAVRLMSIHKAKGLEFPIVFLPQLHKGAGGDDPIIAWNEDFGLGIKWRDPASWEGAGDQAWLAIADQEKRRDKEEENRLLYVAMTRAEQHLALSFAAEKKWAKLITAHLRSELVERVELLPQAAQIAQAVMPAFLDKPPVTGQYDSAVSVTSVSLFNDCPRKYFLSRYLGYEQTGKSDPEAEFPPRDSGELTATELGIQVHEILAGQPVDDPEPEAVELAARFEASELGRLAAQSRHAEREFDILVEVHGMVLRGQIDLWFEHKGKIFLVDYKTDRKPSEAYAVQLQIYAIALERLTGKPVEQAWLYFLRTNQAVEVDLSPLQLESAREAVRELREAQDQLRFELNEGDHCYRCDYFRGLCPAGKTSGPRPPLSPLSVGQPSSAPAPPSDAT